jgi:autotransporter-associated beta strand protein
MNAQLHGAGGFTKNGLGELSLNSSNTYSGLTTVNDGFLLVDATGALGSTASGTVVNSGAMLGVRFGVNVGNEPLTLAGTGQGSFGALSSSFGSNTWLGTITLSADATIYVDAGDTLQLFGSVTGPFDLTKTGTGQLYFSGDTANTFNNMTINAGTLFLNKLPTNAVFAGDLFLGDGAGTDTVRLLSDNQIPDAAGITMGSFAVLDLNDMNETTGAIRGNGTIDLGSGILRAGADNGSTSFGGVIIGTGSLFKLGTGTWTLNGNNSYSGSTTVSAGTLIVNGSQASSDVTVNGTATLGGDGVVGDLDVFGNLRPGTSPAIFTSGNFVFRSASSDYFVELNGPTPGSGYDQLKVLGTVGLSNATLHATLGFQSASSNTFTIVDNDGADAVIGTFNGLGQNAILTINGIPFRITYTGGTGNDVVLTQLLGLPILSILRASTNVVLSWPTNVTGFMLESRTNVNSGIWMAVSPAPVVIGTNNVVTNAVTGAQQYYRLRNP